MNIVINMPQAIHELGQRKNQEDTIFPAYGNATADSRLFMVCDGMGGYDSGEVASQLVATTMAQCLEGHLGGLLQKEVLQEALNKAYDALNNADEHPQEPVDNKMGTTLTLLAFSESGVSAMHMGDSRIYHFRPATRELRYRSKDHSYVQQLYDLGEVNYEQMRQHPQKNIVIRALRPNQEQRQKAEIVQIVDIESGDYFLIGSDGMFENMDEHQIMDILADTGITDREKRDRLVRMSEDSQDNHSAYLIGIDSVKRYDDDKQLIDEEARVRAANQQLYDDIMSTRKQNNDTTDSSLVEAETAEPISQPGAVEVAEVEALEVTTPHRPRYTAKPAAPHKPNNGRRNTAITALVVLLALAIGIIGYLLINNNSQPKPAVNTPAPAPRTTTTTPLPAPHTQQQSVKPTVTTPSSNHATTTPAETVPQPAATGKPAQPGNNKVNDVMNQLGGNPQKPAKPAAGNAPQSATSGTSQQHNTVNGVGSALSGAVNKPQPAKPDQTEQPANTIDDTE